MMASQAEKETQTLQHQKQGILSLDNQVLLLLVPNIFPLLKHRLSLSPTHTSLHESDGRMNNVISSPTVTEDKKNEQERGTERKI